MKLITTIAIGALGGSALGLYTGTTGTIFGAVLGALLLTYIEYLRPKKEAEN